MKILKKIKKCLMIPIVFAITVISAIFILWISLKKKFTDSNDIRKLAKEMDQEAREAIENNENTQKTITKQYNDYLSSFNKFKSRHKMH